jgi:glycosyltransferase involved in cell wall biosynthesis
VIEALPHVLSRRSDAHLVIIGRGPFEDELRAAAKHHDVADRVTITQVPPADREAMATALAEASVVAALSDYEAHPVAVMEALSVGRPVVGYDIAGIGDLVADGLVEGVTPGAAPAAVADQLLGAMSAESSAVLPELPTWDTSAAELGELYLSATGRGSRPRAAVS